MIIKKFNNWFLKKIIVFVIKYELGLKNEIAKDKEVRAEVWTKKAEELRS